MKYIKKTILGILIVICCIILIKILKNNYLNQDLKSQSQTKNFSNMQTVSLDNFWCSTFQMAWKELARSLDVENIEFIDDEKNELVDKLNNNLFGLNSISNNGYYLYVDDAKPEAKTIIAKEMKKSFNKSSSFLDAIDLSEVNGKIIYSYLERNYTFFYKFEETDVTFLDKNNNISKVKGFGFLEESNPEIIKNVTSAYYAYTSYGICLDTKENEEIILIIPSDIEKDFQTLWEDYQKDQREFGCDITTKDRILIPYVNINCFFNYNELCGKYIKNTAHYISNAIQNIKFSLNEYGGKVETENLITSIALSARPEDTKAFSFNKPFVIFIKEKEKEEPYIAIKVYDESFLVLNQ